MLVLLRGLRICLCFKTLGGGRDGRTDGGKGGGRLFFGLCVCVCVCVCVSISKSETGKDAREREREREPEKKLICAGKEGKRKREEKKL